MLVPLAGCTSPATSVAASSFASEAPGSSSAPASSPSAAATPPAAATEQVVSFTYECTQPDPDDPTVIEYRPYDSWQAVWENPSVTSCRAMRTGEVITAHQQEAIDLGAPAYGSDDPVEILTGLSIQCAITANGYLALSPFSGAQIDEVRGILALCPDRPGADVLRAGLPG